MKIAIIIIGILLAILVYITVLLICLYEKGRLPTVHALKKPTDGEIKIACIGDSITYGNGHLTKRTYPAVLGNLLGAGYCVNNYGYSARTALKCGDYPYINEKLHQKSLAFNPDIVIIMFGTNDSKSYNWKSVEEYFRDYLYIVNLYKNLTASPKIYVLAPPPAWGLQGKPVKFDINAEIIADKIRPAIKTLARENDLHFIDMYAVFENKPDLFPDGVHPNADGARLFAETIFRGLDLN